MLNQKELTEKVYKELFCKIVCFLRENAKMIDCYIGFTANTSAGNIKMSFYNILKRFSPSSCLYYYADDIDEVKLKAVVAKATRKYILKAERI